jgi:hypothetical protein
MFEGYEKLHLDAMANVAERFSPHEEDIKNCANFYFSEEQVKEKFGECIMALPNLFNTGDDDAF